FNPLRRVPVLVLDDGEALVESAAILDALDAMAVERGLVPLLPAAGASRRRALRIAALATGAADKAVSLLYEHVLRKGPSRNAVWVERCTAQIGATLDVLEAERAAIGDGPWLGSLSHAD